MSLISNDPAALGKGVGFLPVGEGARDARRGHEGQPKKVPKRL
jgi:hypothetical protein